MINMTKEQAKALGFDYPAYEDEDFPVEIDEVKGATIAGLYMDNNPQSGRWKDAVFRIVLVLSDNRVIVIKEGGHAGYMEAEFGTLRSA
jgi:hypothetical protein